MSDLDDGESISPQKYPAKSSENDKDALLASGDEKEEYTDIFEGNSGTGRVVTAVDFEDGESVSASDNEITGYTGDQENYTESELESNLIHKASLLHIPEATLVDINDTSKESTLNEILTKNETDQTTVTNETITEIAVKLSEIDMNPSDVIAKPGKPVKMSEEESNQHNMVIGDENDSTGGYSGSEDVPNQENRKSVDRKKKYRKRTTSRDGALESEESLSSSGEVSNDRNLKSHSVNDGSISVEQKHKPKKKRDKTTQHQQLSEENQAKQFDQTKQSNPVKLIDIETPPSTKTAANSAISDKLPNLQSVITKGIQNSNTKRKRTRHKIYLDDPDVHQLINDHIIMLLKYADDLKTGNFRRKKPQMHSGYKSSQYQQNMSGIPPQSFNQQHQHQQRNYQQHQQPPFSQHPQQQPSFSQQPQKPQFVGVKPRHQYMSNSNTNYNNSNRGRDVVTRIRDDRMSSTSSDEDEPYRNGRHVQNHGYNKLSGGANPSDLYLCPDCGEYHHENEVSEVQEICPDCGVAHNPYEHRPSQNNAWQKYKDACRGPAKPNQKYEKVSTEQDPDDVRQDTLPSIEGPHSESELTTGVRYTLKYLGSCQITTQHPVTKETRMQQAQDAYKRIKGQDDEDDDDVSTNVDMFISLERIKIINKDMKFEDVMMDHALRTVCFICDMSKILVLMARRLTSDNATDFSIEQGKPITLGSIVGDREKKTSKNICHVFEGEIEASIIAKAIGQAFNIAYRNFLKSNGIAHEHVEEAEYGHVLESQRLIGQDLDRLTDKSSARDIVVVKRRGEALGIMLLESGWGSMLPTVFIAHLANYSAAARSQRLTVGDHILSVNGASLVGLPLSECNTILKNTKSSERVLFRVVSCPPVVDVVVTRPDVKYQLGFSVQNGTICSLLRGGIAERGGVRVGHRIIEINGDSVVAKSHQHIVDILATTSGSISMKTMPVAMYRLMVGEDLPLHV